MKKDTIGLIVATILAVCFSIVLFSVTIKYLQQAIEQKPIQTVCEKGVSVIPKEQAISIKIKIEVPQKKLEKAKEISVIPLPSPLPCVQGTPSIISEQPATITKTIAKIAIILDDAGYCTGGFVSKLWRIKVPLTISIIPGIICSREAAEISHRCGFEVMLHMPMEFCSNSKITEEDLLCLADRKNDSPYKWALLCGMSEKEVARQLDGAIKDIPYLKGVNNHMGSRATADKRLMALCMDKLKGKGLYFVDSVTTAKTVAYKLAKANAIDTAKRDVFLDNINNVEHVRQQMNILIATAKKNGTAIGIGHITKAPTVAVLSEMVPLLKAQGIEVVPASALVH